MFKIGDLVNIKPECRNPGETNQVYRVVNVNDATKRCYIELAESNLPLNPQELVTFDMIEPAMRAFDIKIMSYGTQEPVIIEANLVDSGIDANGNAINPEDFMYFGDYRSYEDALQAHHDEAGDLHYRKQHDC